METKKFIKLFIVSSMALPVIAMFPMMVGANEDVPMPAAYYSFDGNYNNSVQLDNHSKSDMTGVAKWNDFEENTMFYGTNPRNAVKSENEALYSKDVPEVIGEGKSL